VKKAFIKPDPLIILITMEKISVLFKRSLHESAGY